MYSYGLHTQKILKKFKYPMRIFFLDVPHAEIKNMEVATRILEDAHGAMIVFDITNIKSMQAVDQWRALFPVQANNILLIANKADKRGHVISPSSLDAYTRDCGYLGWYMTSTANGE